MAAASARATWVISEQNVDWVDCALAGPATPRPKEHTTIPPTANLLSRAFTASPVLGTLRLRTPFSRPELSNGLDRHLSWASAARLRAPGAGRSRGDGERCHSPKTGAAPTVQVTAPGRRLSHPACNCSPSVRFLLALRDCPFAGTVPPWGENWRRAGLNLWRCRAYRSTTHRQTRTVPGG